MTFFFLFYLPALYSHGFFPIFLYIIADADAFKILLEMKMKKRQKKPALPSTVTELSTEDGSKVYVVGTAHFSDSSKKDVVKVNSKWKPFSSIFRMFSIYH